MHAAGAQEAVYGCTPQGWTFDGMLREFRCLRSSPASHAECGESSRLALGEQRPWIGCHQCTARGWPASRRATGKCFLKHSLQVTCKIASNAVRGLLLLINTFPGAGHGRTEAVVPWHLQPFWCHHVWYALPAFLPSKILRALRHTDHGIKLYHRDVACPGCVAVWIIVTARGKLRGPEASCVHRE